MARAVLTAAMLLGCATALAQAPAPAPSLYTERSINAALAQDAVNAAVEACAGRGHRVTAVVVDRSGIMKAMLRADGAGPHGVWAARAKAYTAASTRIGTTQLLEAVRANPGATRLPDVEGFLILGGGLPIRVGDEVVGGIGVDGAPGGLLDDQCAEAGIARIRDRLG
ncbi:MAG: GlcG [Rhodospirillales bacterium]|nr:GlcG [Rhodospirillales bacterium]